MGRNRGTKDLTDFTETRKPQSDFLCLPFKAEPPKCWAPMPTPC
jgi:hypothetical protein